MKVWSMPVVSIVIPVYNGEKYIEETLSSIRDQSFKNFEVLVVDDCSLDSSAKKIKNFCMYDKRFRYLKTEKNFGGPAGPRNVGVCMSTAPLIAFCDADDLWMPWKLSLQVSAINETSADLICGMAKDFKDGESPQPKPGQPAKVALDKISYLQLMVKNWIPLSSVLANKKSLEKTGIFNEAKDFIAVEDYDFWLRMASSKLTLLKINTPIINYRKVNDSISVNKTMMIRKALNVIAGDYKRKKIYPLFFLTKPFHLFVYIFISFFVRFLSKRL